MAISAEQLRAFSKRTVAIETRLEANGELVFDSKAERMRADERASLATRARKDKALTPERARRSGPTMAGSTRRPRRPTRAELFVAGERRWGRRDNFAVERAERELVDAGQSRDRCAEGVAAARERVDKEREAVSRWADATKEASDERDRLTSAVGDLDGALNATRAQRIASAALDPRSELWRMLGPPPGTRGGVAAWCGIAERVDAWTDGKPTTKSNPLDCIVGHSHPILGSRRTSASGAAETWDRLVALLNHADDVVRTASGLDPLARSADPLEDRERWQLAVKAADQALAAERPVPAVDRSCGRSLGM
ncbi:MAG TPA: hypothetical protein VNA57_01745 [Acidimicrobiales bacterium]|nr:hypothetical protein [Acidimicrobiales bacterium]